MLSLRWRCSARAPFSWCTVGICAALAMSSTTLWVGWSGCARQMAGCVSRVNNSPSRLWILERNRLNDNLSVRVSRFPAPVVCEVDSHVEGRCSRRMVDYSRATVPRMDTTPDYDYSTETLLRRKGREC